MPSVFDAIKGKTYTRPVETLVVSKTPKSSPQQDLVLNWKKDKSPENTRKVLQYLNPTIESALHSYVPGQQSSFKLKAASLALKALDNYDKSSNASPATFVFTNLQRLNRIRRDRETPIHIPESQVYAKQQLERKQAELEQRLGRQPSQAQLCDYAGISKKKLERLQSVGAMVSQSATADIQTGADTVGDKAITDKDYYDYVYASVSPIDQKIMQWSSGFGKKQLSNNQIAHKLGMSAGAVSQHKAKIQELMGKVRGIL